MLLRSILTPMLLFCILVAPGAAMDTVVCIGIDGHVQLEAARHGRCRSLTVPPSAWQSPTGGPLAEADHCGSCVDLPVLIGATREYPGAVAAPPAQLYVPVPVLTVSAAVLGTDLTTAFSLVSSPLFLRPVILALRTVVLLI
jgi:hypothetical protein